jgi:Cof subfamily protein (haloacid dehalogenase superfamily)
VRKAIEKVHDLAVLVTIATGREARLASKFARELNIVSPIVCAQGGCIYHVANERVLHEVRLPPGLLPRIVAAARLYGWNIHFEMSDRLYFPRESNHPPALFELLRYSNWVRVGDLLRDMPEPPHKVIVTLNQTEDRARVIAEMQTSLGADLNIVASHPHLVEGLPAGVNKAHGLSWLTRYLGVDQKNVFAIGDSEADLPMLEWAGIGVAMGNGSAEVKAAADWVAPTLEEDGAAVALERFVLNRTKI